MTLNRGFTNEGDRIIDYLENGIFEAVDKQYLRKVIFGIYLDSKDPNNLVEAYTFNFHYHKLPGSDSAIPIMTLGDEMSKMSLARSDPVSEALKKGQMPTLGEVKRSVKSLITTINQMENLPKNRYGNFKLFFNEDAPDDYQPPHFQAADAEANRWFFTTHAAGEVPERTSIGRVNAGWHGVDMKVVSVSSYLPSITEDNNAPFAGITSHTAPKLTPVEEARIRVEDAQLQKKDALERNIVWSVDEDEDAEGEMVIDEGIVLSRFGGDVLMAPVGVRSEDGGVRPFSQVDTSSAAHAQYGGISESTPMRVGDLNIRKAVHNIEGTQQIPATQEIVMGSPIPAPKGLSLPASDIASPASAISTQEVDTQYLKDLLGMRNEMSTAPDSEMLGMTSMWLHPLVPCLVRISVSRTDQASDEDLSGRCMGYHGARDKRLPARFICLDCRLRGSHDWDIFSGKIHADMIARYKDLALFRRAIKIFEVHQPSSAALFREHIGCDTALIGQLLTRLEEEGFIAVESIVSDELGIGVTRSHAKKGKKTKTKKQKELQKTKYVFLVKAKRSKAYSDYFDPLPEVENRLMGLSDTVRDTIYNHSTSTGVADSNLGPEVTSRQGCSDDESQTQEATQNVLTLAVVHQAEKRKAATDLARREKRLKISIGSGVDLCD
ncbi:HORMA domain-containing protein [Suillus paluster]|uniref:HORMA domain-containing protein n=1 Tax=Suillus paluster TaxID=48578 RepID=UPI001B863CFB|nr:HORMA domain-containing protein [Suillus paluster]KAG1727923.1 HORMA domain-containing protein [Suillus paluster]